MKGCGRESGSAMGEENTSKLMNILKVKLAAVLTCARCGRENSVLLLEDGCADRCAQCGAPLPAEPRIVPTSGKVGLRYLEMALERLAKELLLVTSRLEGVSVTFGKGETSSVPEAPLESGGTQEDGGEQDGPEDDPQDEAARLTNYEKGSGAGIEEIRELLRQDPENRQLKEWLAFSYYINDDYDEAIGLYLELIEENDTAPAPHYYLANSYYRNGYLEAAVEEWKRVVSICPDTMLGRKAAQRIEAVGRMLESPRKRD